MSSKALVWLRRDLRTADHAALAWATEHADSVAVAFVFDSNILNVLPDRHDRRVWFIHSSLAEVDAKLRAHGSRLIVVHGDPTKEIPDLAEKIGADRVVTARDYDPYAVARDEEVGRRLTQSGIKFETVNDIVIREPGEVKTGSGTDFKVYTPYSRVWRLLLRPELDLAKLTPDFSRLSPISDEFPALQPIEHYGFESTELWLKPGEAAGRERLADFEKHIGQYQQERNFPARPGTSGLSVHLRFGTISVRECVRRALAHGPDGDKWLSELIWREFYLDILFNHPRVTTRAFKPEYDALHWPGEEEHFQAWCEGQTGYPIVDAAMRCLNATGWMHNRLRMVAASFLTKDLLVDWRRGEHYFAAKLLDFELASNNGGWQWAASTGADAQPYFRIFNPLLQSEKFDPDGAFIREWIPEIAHLDNKAIHAPDTIGPLLRAQLDYPSPIVNHAAQKPKALALLSSAKS